MIRYDYVRAKVDVYDHREIIVCFAGEYYPITYIDYANRLYHIECEPIGGYVTTISTIPNDPDFYFVEGTMEVIEDFIEDVIEAEILEEIIEDEIYDDDYYDGGDW